MKRVFNRLSLLLMGMMMLPAAMFAQQLPQLPVDKDVRVGKLPNGLTYYIRHNEYPKGQADFYIAQKVGSVLEEDNQRGLAHFLEHMCFNGTTHFPGKSLIDYLESVGVKFGVNLNAYTDIDKTVYHMNNVPVAREGVQDSCLLVLHDWANDLLLEPEEIDAERAVIHEEWRRTNVGQMRILENLLPVMFSGDRYGYRLPIGTMEVVDNFPYQALRDYYEKWYRPDLQGVIVVGDVDVDRIENKIKEMFSDIEMPENPAERIYFPVTDNKGTIYAIGHDPEQKNAIVQLMIKFDSFPDSLKNTPAYYAQGYVTDMITSMLNTRLDDISSKPDAPFAVAGAGIGNMMIASKTKDALSIFVLAKDGDMPSSLAAAYRELLRAVRGGFTITEYDRAKSEYLSQMETRYNNRNKRENAVFSNEYVNSFLDNEPIPGLEYEYQTMQMIANSVPVQVINQVMAQIVTEDNRILLALMPDNNDGKYPSDDEFAQALAAVDGETIEPFVDEVKSEPLIPQLPAMGSVTSAVELKQWGATEWTLSNGVKVILKKTDFKDDEIRLAAVAKGGYSSFADSYANSIVFMPNVVNNYSLGSYTNTDLQKYLAGKQVRLSLSWSYNLRNIAGATTPKDFPTLMELLYMAFTNYTINEDEYVALQNQYANLYHNQEADPQYIFQTKILDALFSNPCIKALSVDVIKDAKCEEIVEITKAMTANAADYTFVIVGNIDFDAIKPLVEQYIATLPADPKTAVKKMPANDPAFDIKGGNGVDTYTAKMETPQTQVAIVSWADMPYTMKDAALASVAGQILSKRLIDIVREKEGAVYSISASGSMSRTGGSPVSIESVFPMKPEMKEKVLAIISEQFNDMAKNITPEELAKVKEYMVKDYTEAKEKNGPWLSSINGWIVNGVDTFNGNVEMMNSLTVDDVKNFMKKVLKQNNYRVVILDPAQ